jgi:hypothetical protein
MAEKEAVTTVPSAEAKIEGDSSSSTTGRSFATSALEVDPSVGQPFALYSQLLMNSSLIAKTRNLILICEGCRFGLFV